MSSTSNESRASDEHSDSSDDIDLIIRQGASFIDSIYRELNESRSVVENLRNSQDNSLVNARTSSVTNNPRISPASRRIVEDVDQEIERIHNYCETIDENLRAIGLLPSCRPSTRSSPDIFIETPMPNSRTVPNRGRSPEVIDLSAFESTVVVPDMNLSRHIPFSTDEVIDLCTPPTSNETGTLTNARRSNMSRRALYNNNGVVDISSTTSAAATTTAAARNTAAARTLAAGRTTAAASRELITTQNTNTSSHPLARLTENTVETASLGPTSSKVRRKTATNKSTDKCNTSVQDDNTYKCPVCFENVRIHEPTTTKCGHVFCNKCIRMALQQTHKCPLCNTKLNRNQVFRIYL